MARSIRMILLRRRSQRCRGRLPRLQRPSHRRTSRRRLPGRLAEPQSDPPITTLIMTAAPQPPQVPAPNQDAARAPIQPVRPSQPPVEAPPPPSSGVLDEQVSSIDLPSVLSLAGVQNPELLVARGASGRGRGSAAIGRRSDSAELEPRHELRRPYRRLQHSSGRIIQLHRQSLYVGAGANAIAAGTVNIPGVQYNLNISNAIIGYLGARRRFKRNSSIRPQRATRS